MESLRLENSPYRKLVQATMEIEKKCSGTMSFEDVIVIAEKHDVNPAELLNHLGYSGYQILYADEVIRCQSK